MAFEELYIPSEDNRSADSMYVGGGKINRNLAKTFEIDPKTGETVTPVILGADFQGNGFSIKGIDELWAEGKTNIPVFEGEEFLTSWYTKLIAGTATKALLAGDSTTSGQSVSAPFIPDTLLIKLIGQFLATPLINVVNYGVGATKTSQWATAPFGPTYSVETQIAQAPDLWIIRYGLNDVSPAELPYSTRIAIFKQSLRTGIDKIRVQQGDNTVTSILIMSPNAALAQPIYEAELGEWTWRCSIACREVAREKGCAFFDTYRLLPDSNGLWQDTLPIEINGFRHLHPNDEGNAMIYSALTTAMLPEYFWNNGLASNAQTVFDFKSASNGAAFGSYFKFIRSRGTLAAPTTTQVSDVFGYIDFQGYDGASFTTGARISVPQYIAATSGHTPAGIEFALDNGGGLSTRFTFTNSGLTIASGNIFMADGSSIRSTGSIDLVAGGTNEHITLTPSGTGDVWTGRNMRFGGGTTTGPCIQSPNGSFWRITVDNAGALSTAAA